MCLENEENPPRRRVHRFGQGFLPCGSRLADGSELLACRNATYGRVAENLDGAIILDLATQVTDAAGRGERMLRDAVHLSDRGADLMSDWMLPQLVALARGEAPPSATPAPTP